MPIDEKAFLEKMQKSLGVEIDLSAIEEKHAKKRKEGALLESLNNALTKLTIPELKQVEEVFAEPVNISPTAEIIEQLVEQPQMIVEIGRQPEPELPKADIVTKAVIALSKPNQQDGNIQAVADKLPPGIQKELDIIKKSLADFHRFAQRHSQMGGGGAGDIVHLDHQTKTVYSNYVYTNKDYYIGAGITPLTITLPTIAKNGRVIAIKDEVGNCSQYPITVQGMVDNDAGGFILAENNGGVQMIYNNGSWRII